MLAIQSVSVVKIKQMLVPRTQLLIWVALIILPFSILGAVAPATVPLSVAGILALILAALLDAVLAYSSLNGVQVTLPEIVRLTKDREGSIEVTIAQTSAKQKRLRVGLPFPAAIVSPYDDLITTLPQETPLARLLWSCTPLKRGRFRIETCSIEGISPLGFWAFWERLPVSMEIRVYPNLASERNNLAALFLNKGGVGIHAQRQVGKGREFEKLREYIPGDSYEDIHWKATAKRRHPVTKVFQIERTQEVYVIIDASRLSARMTPQSAGSRQQATGDSIQHPASSPSYLERFITAALIMGLAAQKQGDLFGVVTFSDQIRGFVRAKSGKAHYSTCRDILYALEPQRVNPDFDELCTFLRLRLRRRALLVFLTNLDDPILAESFLKNIELIHRQHLLLVNMLRPAAARPVFSHTEVSVVDDLYGELGGHLLWHDLRELERKLHHRGVNFALLENEKLCVELVSQYVNVKQRQVL